MTTQELLQTIQGIDIEALKKRFADNVAANKEVQAKKTSNIDALTQQILAQNTTDKWTGGFGVDNSAKAMAKLLADAGITDIRQFGKVDKYEPVEVIGYSLNGNNVQRPNANLYYEQIPEYDSEGGVTYRRRDLTPQEIAQVKTQYGVIDTQTDEVKPASNVIERDGKLVGVTGQTWGNKTTGQEIVRGTGRWQRQGGDDLFSGTGEGDGNTGFRVQMSPDGTPVFYTTKGSSSDLADIMPIVQLGLMATGAGGLLGNAILGAGANQIAAGALGGALLGGGTAALSGQDVLKGALLGGAGGALSGYLNPATGQITTTPTDGAIPLTGDEISKLGSTDLGIDYSLSNGTAMRQLTDMGGAQGLQAGTAANLDAMGGGQGFQFNAGAPVTSVADAVKAISSMNGSFNPDNLASMGGGQGLTYQTPTGLVTEGGTLNVGGMTGNNSVISAGGLDTAANIGSDIAKRVAAIDTGVNDIKGATTATDAAKKSGLTVSDALRAAGLVATLAGGSKLASGGGGGYDIVPIPKDWTSPIKPTGTAEFTPLAPIDFGNKEMLRGTQWEQLLSPDYGKAPAMPSMPTNPSNMDFNQLMGILGNTRTSIPTQSVSINDVIAGIQSQYGQTPTGSMG